MCPDEKGTDNSNYREYGVPAILKPFLAALAKAVQKMPMLEHFKLDCELGRDKGHFTILYYAPGPSAEWGDDSEGRFTVQACVLRS